MTFVTPEMRSFTSSLDGSLKGMAFVGYVAFVVLAHSNCLVGAGGSGRVRQAVVSVSHEPVGVRLRTYTSPSMTSGCCK
jgi:hypothetical protein